MVSLIKVFKELSSIFSLFNNWLFKGTYRVQVLHKGTGTWYELHDLHNVLPQMITLSEAYIQIWEQHEDESVSMKEDETLKQ